MQRSLTGAHYILVFASGHGTTSLCYGQSFACQCSELVDWEAYYIGGTPLQYLDDCPYVTIHDSELSGPVTSCSKWFIHQLVLLTSTMSSHVCSGALRLM